MMTHSTVSKPAGNAKPSAVAPQKKKNWAMWIGAASLVVVVAVIWLIVVMMRDDMPRLNESAVVLTKFIVTKRFEQLPFEQQRQFYKVLDDRDAELDQDYASNKLNESEYRAGLEAAWLGKQINRTEKYYALAPGAARTTYVSRLVDKKEKKKSKEKKDPSKIEVDEVAAELKVEKWPPSIRAQWESYHEDYRKQKKATEKAIAATKPTSKPSK